MKILLAIDGSAHSAPAVHEITRQHLPAGSEVRVISVVEANFPVYSEGVVSLVSYEELDKMARERARTVVDQAAAEFRAVYWVLFLAYAGWSFQAVLYHLRDPYWIQGRTTELTFTNSYLI